MRDCIFCEILEGRVEGSIVYKDEKVTALMDIQPVNPGHVLVIPNTHASDLSGLDEEVGTHLFRIGMRLDRALRRSKVNCEGVNFLLADGEAAGQEVFHVHLHVFPRFKEDGFGLRFGPNYHVKPSRETLNKVAEQIKEAMHNQTNMP